MINISNRIIRQFDNLPNGIIATVHKDPDVDAIGSLLALNELMKSFDRHITLFVPDFNPSLFKFLPGIDAITKEALPMYDLAIFLDCSDKSRILQPHAFPQASRVINIDHHQDNSLFGTHNWVEQASSVGEMLFDLFQALNKPISQLCATFLYSAICFDTGNFKFANTTSHTFLVAAELLKKGVIASKISESIFEQKSKKYFDDVRMGLNHMYLDPNYPFMIVHIPNHSQMSGESTINFFRQMEGVEVIIVCKEVKKQQHRISFRSKQWVDVAKIAHHFDGGGHLRAAGATADGSFLYIQQLLINYCVEAFQ